MQHEALDKAAKGHNQPGPEEQQWSYFKKPCVVPKSIRGLVLIITSPTLVHTSLKNIGNTSLMLVLGLLVLGNWRTGVQVD